MLKYTINSFMPIYLTRFEMKNFLEKTQMTKHGIENLISTKYIKYIMNIFTQITFQD